MLNRDNQSNAVARGPQTGLSRPTGRGLFWGGGDPWREMEEMHRNMDDLFSRMFGFDMPDVWQRGAATHEANPEPDVDIVEDANAYTIRAALPGINPDDINVQATDTTISLSAVSRTQSEGDGNQGNAGQPHGGQASQGADAQKVTHRQSRYSRQSRFEFAYTLPEEIKANEVRANFRNGLLELTLPKARVEARGRSVTIPIQAGASGQGAGVSLSPETPQNQSAAAGEQTHQPRDGQAAPASQAANAPAGKA